MLKLVCDKHLIVNVFKLMCQIKKINAILYKHVLTCFNEFGFNQFKKKILRNNNKCEIWEDKILKVCCATTYKVL